MKKAVVTNALSFVGYALCRRLLDEGIEVAAIDDVREDEEKEEKRDYFGRNALFTFFNGKMDQISLREALAGADVCFYETAPLQSTSSLHQAIGTAFHNTRVFLDALPENPPFIVLNSSTEVYGAAAGEIAESNETWPTSLQGIISVVEEALCVKSGLPVAVLRFPEIYGPGQPDDGSFQQFLSGQTPQNQKADVLYIDDAVKACLSVAEKKAAGIFNTASGKPGQWLRGKKYIEGEKESEPTNEQETWFSIEKAEKAFGFQPEMPLEEGIGNQKENCQAGTE